MKKLALMLVAIMAMTGLAGVGSAQAKSYTGTVKTKCHVFSMGSKSHNAAIKPFVFVTSSSNLKATGKITLGIVGSYKVTKKHKKVTVHVSHFITFAYHGGAGTHNLGKYHAGHYTIGAAFKPAKGSVFKGCSTSNPITIT
jgi:hypothetical protein